MASWFQEVPVGADSGYRREAPSRRAEGPPGLTLLSMYSIWENAVNATPDGLNGICGWMGILSLWIDAR